MRPLHFGALTLALFLLFGLPSQAQAQLSFAPAVNFTTGSTPNSIAIGDLDGDGNLDLAVTNNTSTPSTISVLLGNGAGSFGLKTDFTISAIGVLPNFVAIGDLDGDLDLDLAVTNDDTTTVSVFLNTTVPPGPLSFAPPTTFAVGNTPNFVAIADLDGDGDLDIAVTNAANNTVSVLLNTTPPPPPPPPGFGGGGGGGPGCFIATAAFGSPLAPQVELLREFRDRYLFTNAPGRLFAAAYYRTSPPIAKVIADSEILRAIVRVALVPFIGWAALILWSPTLGLGIAFVILGVGAWPRMGTGP